jgi:NodT family efflux transporter outer membrane factor (OMF) lipoprotein
MRYISIVSILSLSACITAGPSYDAPPKEGIQERFVTADEAIYRAAAEDAAPWWESFEDPVLSRLILLCREDNRDLAEAAARTEAAVARTQSAYRALLPQGDASLAVQRQQQAPAAFAGLGGGREDGPGPVIETAPFTTWNAATDLSWEIDIFGRIRNRARSADANAEAQAALLADTLRIVTARTAEAYVTYREAQAREAVAVRNLDSQREALELTQALFDLGEVSELEVARQRTQTELTAAGLEQVKSAKADAASALALLTGRTVPQLAEAVPALAGESVLPAPAEVIAVSDPAAVLRRRPDVARAERQLAAQTYDVGVQTAQLFPQVTVSGSASLTALDFSGLGQDDAFGFAYGPRLSWPVFSYPQLLAELDAAKAETRAAAAAYQRAVLSALTETDAALVAYARSLARARYLEEAQRSAQKTLTLSEARYRAGADSLLSFLDAQRVALDTEDSFVISRAAALRARIAVHRALAD